MVQTEADAGVLSGYSDSDWASDVTTRRSTSGYCIFHGKHLVEAGSASQHTIALSSGEARFYRIVPARASATGPCQKI